MKSLLSLLRKPSITEKSLRLKDEENKLVFEVDPRATKREIRRAVEEAFGVRVERVTTMRIKGKRIRRGRTEGIRPERKKAVIQLKRGEKVDLFEGKA